MLFVKHKFRLTGHVGRVWCVDWNQKGDLLASCGEDKSIRVWKRQDGLEWTCAQTIKTPHKRTLRRVRWSKCGKTLAACSFDGTITFWDTEHWDLTLVLEGHENEVKSIDWSMDGEWFASCSRDKSVWIWKVNQDSNDYECSSVLTDHTQDVKMVKWHPLYQALYSASYDNSIKCYEGDDDEEWNCTSSLNPHESTVWALDFNRGATMATTCSEDKTLKIWNWPEPSSGCQAVPMSDWKCIAVFSHTRPVYNVSWSHVDDLIATACGDNAVRIFEGGGGGEGVWKMTLEVTSAHCRDINAVCWNPMEACCLASCGDDEEVIVWGFERKDAEG